MREKIGEGYVEARLDTSRLSQDVASVERSIGQKFQQVGAQLQTTGKKLTRSLTLPIVGVGVGILKVAGDFQSSMNMVRAVTGATGSDFAKLEDQAKELGRTTQFSASEAAGAMYYLASAGFDTNEVLATMPGTLQLAAAAQMDLATAADITSNVLSGYGLEVEEIGRVNDALVKTFQSTNTNLQQLGEAFKYAGPVAKGAGLEFEDTAAALGLMGQAGFQGSMAGTALRGAMTALLNPTGKAANILNDLGINAVDAEGNLRPLDEIIRQLESSGMSTAQMMQVFGQRAGPAMVALVGEGSDALSTLSGELREAGGTAERVADIQMEGLNGAMARLKSAAEGVAISIAQSGLIDGMANFADKVAGMFTRLAEANPQLLKFGTIIAGAVAAAGPVMWAVGAALSALGALLSPAGLIIGGLAALVAALVKVTGEGDTFSERFMSAIGKLQDFLGPAISWVGDKITSITEFFGLTRKTVGEEIAAMSNEAVGEVVDMVAGMTDKLSMLAHDGGTLSVELADEWIGNVERMRDDAVAAANEHYAETITTYTQLARDLGSISTQQADEAIAAADRTRRDVVVENETMAILVTAAIERMRDDGVEITAEHAAAVIENFENQRDAVLEALLAQETESAIILARLRAESGQITLETAATAIKNSADQRDATVAAADEEYRDRVAAILQMQRDSDEFTQAMADAAIEEARRMRDVTVSVAEEQHAGVVGEVAGMRANVESEVDTLTGNVLSKWDRFYADNLKGWVDYKIGLYRVLDDIGTGINSWFWDLDRAMTGQWKNSWDSLQRLAASGVNGLIWILNKMGDGMNFVSRALGMGNTVEAIAPVTWGQKTTSPGRMHSGGVVDARSGEVGGPTSLRPDEHLKILQEGEEVITADDPRHISRWRETHPTEVGDGGGIRGSISRLVSRVSDFTSSVASKVRQVIAKTARPLVERMAGSAASRLSGYGTLGKMGARGAEQAGQNILEWMSGIDSEAKDREVPELGGGVGWKAMWSAVSGAFPWARLTSAYRPGAITATGNPSYHGMGRAVDLGGRGYMDRSGMAEISRWIAENYQSQTRELIYSGSGGRQLHNGRPHTYTGATRQNHFDHVHWAMGDGAVIKEPTLGLLGEKASTLPEIVTPQKLMADTFRGVLGEGALTVQVVLGDQMLGEATYRGLQSYQRRNGPLKLKIS